MEPGPETVGAALQFIPEGLVRLGIDHVPGIVAFPVPEETVDIVDSLVAVGPVLGEQGTDRLVTVGETGDGGGVVAVDRLVRTRRPVNITERSIGSRTHRVVHIRLIDETAEDFRIELDVFVRIGSVGKGLQVVTACNHESQERQNERYAFSFHNVIMY